MSAIKTNFPTAATGTAGDFFSFTVGSGGSPVSYQSLSFLRDQCGTTGKIDISRTIGGTPTFILEGFTPAVSNASVALQTIAPPSRQFYRVVLVGSGV